MSHLSSVTCWLLAVVEHSRHAAKDLECANGICSNVSVSSYKLLENFDPNESIIL